MHPLYQRLRELDWDTFQRFAFQLLSEKHPGLKIRHVEGAGGDRGLDLFEGQLRGRPAIWQCKHFPNGLGPKQRPQVKESLRAALKYFKPRLWVLVISVDLDGKGHEWFQKLQNSYVAQTAIGLLQSSDIVRELIHRRKLRDVFFPGAVFDTITVRRAIQDMSSKGSEQLQQSTSEQLDELIARLEESDARFEYQIAYGPNIGADIVCSVPQTPLLVASVLDHNRRIDVFARDIEALTLDPVKIKLTFRGSGMAKLQKFLRTGQRQEFATDEVSNPSSTLDFLIPKGQGREWRAALMPSRAVTGRQMDLRVTFANGSNQVLYELVKFRVSSVGSDQVEIESVSPLPFVLSFTLPLVPGNEGSFKVQERFEGADLRSVAKAIRAMSTLATGGNIELFALEQEKPLGVLAVTMATSERRQAWEEAVLAAAEVSESYDVNLRLPEKITGDDLRAITLLSALAKGGALPLESFSGKLVKTKEHEHNATAFARQRLQVIAQFKHLEAAPKVFGTIVETGPVSLLAKEAEIVKPELFVQRYEAASYGEDVEVTFQFKEVRGQRGFIDPTSVLLLSSGDLKL